MQRALLIKLGAIVAVTLALLVPLSMIEGKIGERSRYKIQAKNSIAKSWTGAQKLVGPILVIPYELEWNMPKNLGNGIKVKEKHRETRFEYLLPAELNISGKIDTSLRAKGIYEVPVYTSSIEFKGEFSNKRIDAALTRIQSNLRFSGHKKPYLALYITDPRGINSIPKLLWGKDRREFNPGSKLKIGPSGMHAILSEVKTLLTESATFSFEIDLRGMQSITFVPTAQQSHIDFSSGWPHPEFVGSFLPLQRKVDETGFSANWKVTSFSNNTAAKVKSCERGKCSDLANSGFGVSLIEPVDIYLQSQRSVKYGLLFVGLSFVAFFLFEVLTKLRIHAVQYILVGLALAIFYLLLISLSEHISFAIAYSVATIACVGLLIFYISFVLNGLRQSVLFGGMLALLYGILYVIITAEDFALLMGSTLTFIALVSVMFITRKVDWYQAGEQMVDKNILKS